MADSTGIEWTRGDDGSAGATWNPVTGCDRVTAGCQNCYALTMAKRLKAMGAAHYQTDGDPRTSGPGFGVAVHPDALDIPLRWRRPRRVFVNSMSDLFHPQVPDEFIGSVFDVMARTPRHTYQILTKRPARARSLLNRWADPASLAGSGPHARASFRRHDLMWCEPDQWPLLNVWLGVSVEDQEQADRRIPLLRETPAAVRWVSAEPLLGPVDLGPYLPTLDWVVAGGESGPRARPMDAAWVQNLRAQCAAAGVPFFMKQAGAVLATLWGCTDRKGHNPGEWPEPFPRQYPDPARTEMSTP